MSKLETNTLLHTPDGPIIEYTLDNGNMQVRIMNYGATITAILLPNRSGLLEHVVIARQTLADYMEARSAYFGATVGRTAGRIPLGKLTIDGTTYELTKNRPPHSSHGGQDGFSFRLWSEKSFSILPDGSVELTLSYHSADGEEGYPGTVEAEVTYRLDLGNRLHFSTRAVTDKATAVNMTNHSYFNLSGNLREDILSHTLFLDSAEYQETSASIATGNILSAKGTHLDYRTPRLLSQELEEGIDHCFLISPRQEQPVAVLSHEKSGRRLSVYTDQPALVVFTDNKTHDEILFDGSIHQAHASICFEAQQPSFDLAGNFVDNSILRPDQVMVQNTTYAFEWTPS